MSRIKMRVGTEISQALIEYRASPERRGCMLQVKFPALWIATLLLGITGCAQYPRFETGKNAADETVHCESDVMVSRQGTQIWYRGELTAQGMWAVNQLSKGRPIETLVVTSSGGEINIGMDLGDWVLERGASVVVGEFCLSSCANYVFPAGWQKTILPGALVAWHGSARQQDLPDQLARVVDDQIKSLALGGESKIQERNRRQQEVSDYLKKSIARQDAFFEKLGVEEYITRVGNERYGINGFYCLSSDDMARFGITNVTVPENYVTTDYTRLQRRLGVPITHLKLNESDNDSLRSSFR